MAKKALKDMRIAAYGGGRMGRGIGISFALAGAELLLIDSRPRDDWAAWQAAAKDDIGQMLSMLAALDLLPAEAIETLQARIHCLPHEDGLAALAECDLLFEAVPETEEAKKQAFAQLDTVLPEAVIIASTTSVCPSVAAHTKMDWPSYCALSVSRVQCGLLISAVITSVCPSLMACVTAVSPLIFAALSTSALHKSLCTIASTSTASPLRAAHINAV